MKYWYLRMNSKVRHSIPFSYAFTGSVYKQHYFSISVSQGYSTLAWDPAPRGRPVQPLKFLKSHGARARPHARSFSSFLQFNKQQQRACRQSIAIARQVKPNQHLF
jgi:hypothetical protein